jgi:shikimate kinase
MNRKSIILMGMKHSGKSTLAGMLAWEMKRRNVDLDELIEEEYRSDRLLSCREIYKQHGVKFFKALEISAAKKLAGRMEEAFLIASLGGDTIENDEAIEALEDKGTFIHLVVDLDILYNRIMKGGLPAFLSEDRPYEDFAALFKKRSRLMEERADVSVLLPDDAPENSFERLKAGIKEYGYAW